MWWCEREACRSGIAQEQIYCLAVAMNCKNICRFLLLQIGPDHLSPHTNKLASIVKVDIAPTFHDHSMCTCSLYRFAEVEQFFMGAVAIAGAFFVRRTIDSLFFATPVWRRNKK